MPLQGEFAQHKILSNLTTNKDIVDLLENCKETEFPTEPLMGLMSVLRRKWSPKFVVAIDGSHQEIQYDKGFPGSEFGFLSIANVLINVDLLVSECEKPTIDPVIFNKIQSAYNLTAALPSSNMIKTGFPDARSSFRAAWNDLLVKTRPAATSETLMETYQALLKHKPTTSDQRCPLMELCTEDNAPSPDYKKGTCACGKQPVYETDILRIHERFTDFKSNGESLGEVMRVLEHLILVAYLRYMEQVCLDSNDWTLFIDTAIVMDGSLAVFGHPAWLSQSIKKELKRINTVVKLHTKEDILVFGIEKSGRFFDHWNRLDTKSKKDFEKENIEGASSTMEEEYNPIQPGRIPRQTVLLPDDGYIKTYVVPSVSTKPHGADTYYGRPLLYKTRTGAMIVGISAILSDCQDDRSVATPEQYPRLGDTLDLLDLLVSMRYPNAVIPLIAAHSEAAIPLQMGEKVLDKLTREHLGQSAK